MIRSIALLALMTLAAGAQLSSAAPAARGGLPPSEHYDVLTPPVPTSVGPGKVEVVEVFWLGCPHCYALEPYLRAWQKNKPAYVEFVRVPVIWNPMNRAHARLYYSLLALKHPELVEKAFDAIHQQHMMLAGATDEETLKSQQEFAVSNGISADEYAKAYNSFAVNTNLGHAEELTHRYQVKGVPLIVVDGKYTTDVAKAGGFNELIALIDQMAAAEHQQQH